MAGGMRAGGGMCSRRHAWISDIHDRGCAWWGWHIRGLGQAWEGHMRGKGSYVAREDSHSSRRYVSYWDAFLFPLFTFTRKVHNIINLLDS